MKKQNFTDNDMRDKAYEWFSKTTIIGKLMTIAYYQLIDRLPVTYASILAEHQGISVENYLQKYRQSGDKYYRHAKEAMKRIRQLLEWKAGPDCMNEDDAPNDKRSSIYQYVGAIEDPLIEELTYIKRLEQEDYVAFCESADGFMPDDWFTHFFQRTPILRDKKNRDKEGQQKIQSGANSILTNIKMLPDLFEHIQKRHVLEITIAPFVQKSCTVVFHPQYLKEYNGRWYVYGQGQRIGIDDKPIKAFSTPLDRIVGSPKVIREKYVSVEPGFYEEYFRNIIGVSHGLYDGKEMIPMGKQDVVIRVHDRYMYGLVTTKKFHRSQQETLEFGHQADGQTYGEITIFGIEPNNELIGKILQMGVNLEVMQPVELRNKIKKDIRDLLSRYE